MLSSAFTANMPHMQFDMWDDTQRAVHIILPINRGKSGVHHHGSVYSNELDHIVLGYVLEI